MSTALTQALARRLGALTRYSAAVLQYQRLGHDSGELLAALPAPKRGEVAGRAALRKALAGSGAGSRVCVLVNGNFNHSFDIQGTLQELAPCLRRRDRVLLVAYNPYWAWAHRLAAKLGLRKAAAPGTFFTRTDLRALARLSGFEAVRFQPAAAWPLQTLGLGPYLNAFLEGLPLLRELSFAMVVVLRPVVVEKKRPSLTIIVPARDERGNIEGALNRLPDFGAKVELIFVEGASTDGTWEEMQRVAKKRWKNVTVKLLKQEGKGKAGAVRTGFAAATGDLLTILDADLTMPPELLLRFYDAWVEGQADFINGSRLVYPMEGEAMRPLNWLGNIFFMKALSHTLDMDLGDALCGTKLFARADHADMLRWQADFKVPDPFGDFEMIFPAAVLALGSVDIPIRYRARTYGSTKISRFRDAFLLLRMVWAALGRVRFGGFPR